MANAQGYATKVTLVKFLYAWTKGGKSIIFKKTFRNS